jgi:hypothetical protein
MKLRVAAIVTLLWLATGIVVPAKKIPARPFFLDTPITMGGAEIPHGMYELTVESNNSNVRVTFWKEGEFVATARGAWVKSGVKYTENAVLLRVNSDGTRSLIEIRLAGTTKTIVLKDTDSIIRLTAK